MDALIIVALAGIILLGFFLLQRVGKLSYQHSKLEFLPAGGNRGVLICGGKEEIECVKRKGMTYTVIGTGSVISDSGYSALFAVSHSTEANLQICREMRLLNRDILIIARCGEPELADSFETIGVNRILTDGESLQEILSDYRRSRHDHK